MVDVTIVEVLGYRAWTTLLGGKEREGVGVVQAL